MFTIDLHHAEHITGALEQLEHELFLEYKKKETPCRVVYGIGTGALRKAVLEALAKNPMIKSCEEEEIGGSCLVYV